MRQPELRLLHRMAPVGSVAGRAGELDDVQTRVGAIGRVDVTTIIYIEVVRLNRRLALLHAIILDAALRRTLGRRRNEVTDFLWRERVANVYGTNTGVEVGEKNDISVVDRRHALIRGVGPEAPTAGADPGDLTFF